VAVTELTAAISGVDHQGTAPLPPAALSAMARLEQALAGPLAADTLTRFEAASAHYRRVATAPAVDFDSLLCAQDEVTMCRCQLAAAVTPDVQRAVDRFRALSDSIDRVSSRDFHYMTTSEIGELHDMQEERAQIHARLAAAGRLDLIEVAA
jgi:hypothetical protein